MEQKIKEYIPKKCKNPECSNSAYSSLIPYCGFECRNKMKPPLDLKLKSIQKPIPRVSEKRKKLNKIYEVVRIEILTEAKFVCFVDNCKNIANTIEHQRGKVGYFDDWARENDIHLLIDKRFLKPCCLKHNLEFENNPELSKKYQLSKIHKGEK